MTGAEILALLKDERFCNYCLGKNNEDVLYWEKWLEAHPQDREGVEAQKELVLLLSREAASREMDLQYGLLEGRIGFGGRRRSYRMLLRLSVAASVLLAVCLVYYLFEGRRSPAGGVVAVGYTAELVLSDGRGVDLGKAAMGRVAVEGGWEIVKVADGEIQYKAVAGAERAGTVTNRLTTPKGGRYKVQLPDGSVVYLNAASSIKYFAGMDGGPERRVEMSGEALFEVRHDERRSFFVTTPSQVIEDRGTVFTVMSYPDEPVSKTTLISGMVRVAPAGRAAAGRAGVAEAGRADSGKAYADLRPGQQADISGKGLLTTRDVDTAAAVAWKNGLFYFKNSDIKTVMRELTRWYDLEVSYSGEITSDTFNGRISRSLPLSKVLERLEATEFVHFKAKGRKITVLR